MSLARNRKGIELSTLAEVLLLVVGFTLLITLFTNKLAMADEKTSEVLCQSFNKIRFGTKIDQGPVSINVVPRACKTIDRGNIPGKDYKNYVGGVKEGAKAELRNMVANCWSMWLEGNQPNIFDTSAISIKNKCFVCYTFSLSKEAGSITIPEFAASLNSPYAAVDNSDRCAPAGQGGKCSTICGGTLNRETASNRCPAQQKCCISADECVNKGGRCSPAEGYAKYDKWKCSSGTCYVETKNFVSYYDYVQGTGGAGGGKGFLTYRTGMGGFDSGKVYGMAFISPGKSPTWDTLGLGTATIVAGAATAAATYFSPLFKAELLAAGTTGTYYLYGLTEKSGAAAGYNFIYLSEYDQIKDKCSVEASVGEK